MSRTTLKVILLFIIAISHWAIPPMQKIIAAFESPETTPAILTLSFPIMRSIVSPMITGTISAAAVLTTARVRVRTMSGL